MTKQTRVKFCTPIGTAKFPKLTTPFKWSQKDNRSVENPEGDYETLLVVSGGQSKDLISKITEAVKAEGITPETLPYKPEKDRDTGEETGSVEFKLKAYGKRRDGSKNTLSFFDSKGKVVTNTIVVTPGSHIKCVGWISVSKKGVRLNISHVQISSLADAHVAELDEIEGTFVYDNSTTKTPDVAEINEDADNEAEPAFDF